MSDEHREAQEAFVATSFIDFHTQASPSGEWIPMSESEAREVFEGWLAENDAKVRAEALTNLEPSDLADLLQGISEGMEGLANRDALRRAAAVVRLLAPDEQAAQIEREAGL